MIENLFNVSVELIHRDDTGSDRYNNKILEEQSRETVRCYFEQTQTQEVVVDRDTTLSDAQAAFSPSVDITRLDQLLVRGRLYEVVGDPAVAASPSGPHHLEVRLRSVEG